MIGFVFMYGVASLLTWMLLLNPKVDMPEYKYPYVLKYLDA